MKWSNGLKRLRKNSGIRKSFLILFCFLLLLSPYESIVTGLGGAVLAEAEETAMEEEAGKSDIDAQIEEQEEAQETKEMETETIQDEEESEEDNVSNEEKNSLLEQEVEEREVDNEEDAALTKNEQKEENLLENRIDPSDDTIFVHESAVDEKEQVRMKTANISLLNEDIQPFANQSDFVTSDSPSGITITGYNGTETDLTIPSEIDGKTVTIIGERAFEDKNLTSVSLPNTVVTIANYAFQNNQISSLQIPASVTHIGNNAFAENILTTLQIPNTVQGVGQYAFYKNQLGAVTIGSGLTEIKYGVFRDNNLTEITIANNITKIDGQAFMQNDLQTIVLPNTLQEIGNYAFSFNRLTKISIPESVGRIGNDAFRVNKLDEVIVKSPTTIFDGNAIFADNQANSTDLTIKSFDPSTAKDYATARGYSFESTNIFVTSDNANGVTITGYNGTETDLIIPSEIDGKTVTVIGEEAFKGKGLTKITLPNTVVTIGDEAFRNNDLTNLEIPASVINIYRHAFAHNKITALVIPDTVESITAYAFSNNEIANLKIGRGLTEIQVGIFRGNKLKHVTIPDNITRITSQAFYLNEIETIAFPETLKELFGSAFKGNQLTNISIPSSVEIVRDDAFGDNKFGEVTIYNPSTEFQGEVFNGNRGNITIKSFDPSTAKDYATARGYSFETINTFDTSDNPDGTLKITGYNGNDKDLTIPKEIDGKTVTIIGPEAFKGKDLTKITLPNTVATISFEAFQDNQLTNLDLPPSVKEIYGRAFADNKLTALVIPDTVERLVYYTFTNNEIETLQIGSGLTEIGDGIFRGNKLTNVTIPDNITAIRNQAFYINEIETITLPETLQVIEGSAFENNQLTNISIPANVNKIYYRAFNNNLLDEVTIHNPTMIFEENDIFKGNKTNPVDLNIYGHHLSTAQNHAAENNYTFITFSTVASVETLGDIEVDFGTLMADIPLPTEVEIELADARKLNVPVSWEDPLHYNGEEVGSYIFEGQLDLPVYISNRSNIMAKVTVVVKVVPDKEIKDVASIGTMFDVGEKELTEILALLPSKVTVTLDNGSKVDLDVSKWDADSNPVYNKDVAGIYTFSGEIELPAGIANRNDFKATFSISLNEVIVDKKITTSVFASVPLKTGHYEQVDLPLPEKAEVTLSDGSTVELEVDWNPVSSPVYDKDAVGSYRFSGEFKLMGGITNPDKHAIQRDFVLTDAIVLVTYVDEYRNVLAPEEKLEDKMHMDYTTEAKVIDGYTLTAVPTNASGKFQYNDITVTYVYSKNPTESENLEITAAHLQGIVKEVGTTERADILLPNTVTVTLADGTHTELTVTNWDTDSEPRYDKNTPGSYVFKGDLELVDGIANSANIRAGFNVTLTEAGEDEKTSKAISSVPVFGTAFGIGGKDLSAIREHFPTTVELQLEDGSLVELEVKWSENSNPPYEMNTVGAYIFTGEIVLADGITNPEQHTLEYWVNIIDSKEIFDPQKPEESTDDPNNDSNVNKNENPKDEKDNNKDKNNLVVSTKKGSTDDGAMISKDNSTKLPETATSYFNMMLTGLLLSIIGGIIYMIVRKKRIS